MYTSLGDAPVIYASDSEEEEQFFSFTDQPTYKSIDQPDDFESEETDYSDEDVIASCENKKTDLPPPGVNQWKIVSAGSESDIDKISEVSLADDDIEIDEYEHSVDLDPDYESYRKPASSSSIIDRLLAEESFHQISDFKSQDVPVSQADFRRASVDNILTDVKKLELNQTEEVSLPDKRSYDFSDLNSPKSNENQEAFFGKTVVMAGHAELNFYSNKREERLQSEPSGKASFRRGSIDDLLTDVSEVHSKQSSDNKPIKKPEYQFDEISTPKSSETQEAFFGKTTVTAAEEPLYETMARDISTKRRPLSTFETADKKIIPIKSEKSFALDEEIHSRQKSLDHVVDQLIEEIEEKFKQSSHLLVSLYSNTNVTTNFDWKFLKF